MRSARENKRQAQREMSRATAIIGNRAADDSSSVYDEVQGFGAPPSKSPSALGSESSFATGMRTRGFITAFLLLINVITIACRRSRQLQHRQHRLCVAVPSEQQHPCAD